MDNKNKIKQIEKFLINYTVKVDMKEATLSQILVEKEIDLNLSLLAEELTKLGLNE